MATYLSRTPSSAGNRNTFTISLWFKRAQVGDRNCLFSTNGANDHDRFELTIHQNNYLMVGLNSFNIFETTMLFRDTLSWYHIMFVADSTQGSSANRTKLYINGEQITDFSATNQSSISSNFGFGVNNTNEHRIGAEPGGANGTNGYIADFNLIDGAALTPSSFGETDSTTGEWKPKNISGLTYGTNGVYLEFKNAGALGTDTSGNTNTYAVNNAGTNAQTTDTADNNFCTFNDLSKASNVTLSEGNLKATIVGAGQSRSTVGTIAVSKGKWYWEIKYTTTNQSAFIGLVSADIAWNINTTSYPSSSVSDNVGFNDGGTKYVNGSSSSYGSGFGNNDVIGVAANLDDNEVVFYVNGTAQNSGTAISKTFSGDYFPVVQHQSSNGESYFQANFGNPTFTISSGNADAAGHGNFEYAVPSGHFALCTKNLNTYG